MEHTFTVRGMHCASCALVIGKKLRKLPGVTKAEVNYATERATVDYDMDKVDMGQMNAAIGELASDPARRTRRLAAPRERCTENRSYGA